MAPDVHQSFHLGWAVGVNRFSHPRFEPDPAQTPPFQQGSPWLSLCRWIPSQVYAGKVSAMMRKSCPCLAPWRTHLKVRPLTDAMAASPLMIAIFPLRVVATMAHGRPGPWCCEKMACRCSGYPGSLPAPGRLLNVEIATVRMIRAPNVGLDAPTGGTTRIVDSGAGSAQAWRRRTFRQLSF